MKRTGRNTVRFKFRDYRIALSGVREGALNAEVLDDHHVRLTSEAGERVVPIPPLPEGVAVWHSNEFSVLNAMYTLAVHDVLSNCNEQGVLTAGASWDAAWTRDIAFATFLGADLVAPDACRRTLMSRVRNGVIVQDTGTGGGWPISTDRVSWALGAWASYLSTGGQDWLEYSINTLRATLEQDAAVLPTSPLIPGETSFLDWREQSYPRGITPAEIGTYYALSTNMLHYFARLILSRMLEEAGHPDDAKVYDLAAKELGRVINLRFRRPNSSKYAMNLTPDGMQDPHVDSLAIALVVLSGLAGEDADRTLQALERTAYGVPVLAPFKPEVDEAYHNLAIWPFVEAFVMLAYAQQKDPAGVEFCAMSMLRSAMLNVTNKENFHARTGSAADTVSNSDAQLWSAAGMLALYHRVLLGIKQEADSISFSPCIPESMEDSHSLCGLRIRDMVLDVHVSGWGTRLESVLINGQPSSPSIPLDTKGHVRVELQLAPGEGIRYSGCIHPAQRASFGLETPVWNPDSTPNTLRWSPVPGASRYSVSYNGRYVRQVAKPRFFVSHGPRVRYRAYRVQAFSGDKFSSLSVPFEYIAPDARTLAHPLRIGDAEQSYPVENQQAWLDTRPCTGITTYSKVNLPAGLYGVRVCYCNATASLRDADTCALRELHADGRFVGMLVFPHNTEAGRWDDYTLTAMLKCELSEGEHEFSLHFTPRCTNMNGDVNQCMVRYLEIIHLD